MKFIYLFLLTLKVVLPSYAQSIQFEKGSWEQVLTKAKVTNKKIFVDFYTTWCSPCKKMDKVSFRDSITANYFNSNFINYKINAEKSEGKIISYSYKVEGYPTMLYLDPNGILLLTSIGYKKPSDLVEIGKLVNSLESDKRLVDLFEKELDLLSKEELQYIIINSSTYHNKSKTNYLTLYYQKLSERERKNIDIVKLLLKSYKIIENEGIKNQLIYNYFPKRSGLQYSNQDIKLHFKINNCLMEETMVAMRKEDFNDYRNVMDRKLDFMIKTNRIQKTDINKIRLEHNILYYRYHREYDKYEMAAIPLMENYLLPFIKRQNRNSLEKTNFNKASMLSICKTLMKYYKDDVDKNQKIIKWLNEMIASVDLIDAYIYKAKLHKQIAQPILMQKTIAMALTKKLNPIQKKELLSLKN